MTLEQEFNFLTASDALNILKEKNISLTPEQQEYLIYELNEFIDGETDRVYLKGSLFNQQTALSISEVLTEEGFEIISDHKLPSQKISDIQTESHGSFRNFF